MDRPPPTPKPTIGSVLDFFGRLVGSVRFLERPETRWAAERAVAGPLARAMGRIEAVAQKTEAGLVRTARSRGTASPGMTPNSRRRGIKVE